MWKWLIAQRYSGYLFCMLHKLSFPPSVLSSEHLWGTRNIMGSRAALALMISLPPFLLGLWVLNWVCPMQGPRASQVVLVVKNPPANSALAPHERLSELPLVPRQKPGTSAAVQKTHETPPSSRDEGLLFLHGLDRNPESSIQTPQEAWLPLGHTVGSKRYPSRPNVVRGHHVLASGFPGLVEAWRVPREGILAWPLPTDGRTEGPRSSVVCSRPPCKPEAELGLEPGSPDCQFSSVWGARLPPFTFNTNNPHCKALYSF